MTLERQEPADREDPRAPVIGDRRGAGPKLTDVDAAANDVELGPVHRLHKRHQHAALKIAHAGDETRVLHFRPQSMAHDVVVVGCSVKSLYHLTVHREAPTQSAP